MGLGDDILAGICTSITALYTDIYGIRPKWNRMGIEPNMSIPLNGAKFSYTLRDTVYNLELSENDYMMSTNSFSIKSPESFGAGMKGNTLTYYPNNKETRTLDVIAPNRFIAMEIIPLRLNAYSWTIKSAGDYQFILRGLPPRSTFQVSINNETQHIFIEEDGILSIKRKCQPNTKFAVRDIL